MIIRNIFQSKALLGFWLFLLCSCINEIDLKLDMPEDRIAINCMHQTGSAINIYAHKLSSLEHTPKKYSALKMRLIENGVEIGTAKQGSDSVYYFIENFNNTATVEIIDTLSNKFYAGRLDKLPTITIDEAVRYTEITKHDPEDPSDNLYTLHQITFTDQKDVDNYYQICLKSGDTWQEDLFINDAVFSRSTSDFWHRILFTDKLFKNKRFTLSIYSSTWCETVSLRNVSKSYFDYFKSLESHFESQNVFYYDETPLDYFFQPMPVALYSNVTNGLGAFVSYSESQIPFKVHSSED